MLRASRLRLVCVERQQLGSPLIAALQCGYVHYYTISVLTAVFRSRCRHWEALCTDSKCGSGLMRA